MCNSTRGQDCKRAFGIREGWLRTRMKDHSRERLVVAHTAGSMAEAMVIRGLLQSEGIYSPNPVPDDPFPMNEPLAGDPATEILVPESKVKEARRIIAEHLKGNAGAENASDE